MPRGPASIIQASRRHPSPLSNPRRPVRTDSISNILPRARGLFLVLSLFTFLLAGCRAGDTPTRSVSANFLRMTLSAEPPTLDWSLATDNVSITVIQNIMEGLTQFDENLRPAPAVAERWTVSQDGRVYTFRLRRDVRWTDGRPITASDFVYSWRRLLDPKTGAEYAYFLFDVENARAFNTGRITDPSKIGVRALADDLLEVRLNKPIVFFPALTAFVVTFPLRRDIIERYGDHWTDSDHLVTLGPFRLKSWRHEYKLTLIASGDYYGGRPAIDGIDLFVVNERTTALTLYETGEIDLVSLPPEAIPSYAGKKDFHRGPLFRGYYFGFNTSQKPFDDVRVRQAFSLAVDRREFPAILNGGEIPTASWIPPGMFGANDRIGLWFDPGRAQRLLAEAGYSRERRFPRVTAVFNTDPVNTLIAENLQAQWKRVLGVTVALENVEWKVYLRRLATEPPPLFRLGWGADYPDPDNFMALFTSGSGNNHSRWGDVSYDGLISRAAAEFDPARRRVLYDRAQHILTERDAVIMPLFWAVQNILISPRVSGILLDPMEILLFKHARIVRTS